MEQKDVNLKEANEAQGIFSIPPDFRVRCIDMSKAPSTQDPEGRRSYREEVKVADAKAWWRISRNRAGSPYLSFKFVMPYWVEPGLETRFSMFPNSKGSWPIGSIVERCMNRESAYIAQQTGGPSVVFDQED